eukprot:CAMPEP_0172623960 /NCGR_PEP_ID=MMETSP1068-20121228/132880_1 /TAXON_ID=35684 /ORGANISM="Pseudopedinella elastica, Strain CCMP716" /LENGTH=73 /DNA_ID=CAMNT_0013432719 /DNA_START=82 /DNA_END=299 /DNA_ORIENTATION=-
MDFPRQKWPGPGPFGLWVQGKLKALSVSPELAARGRDLVTRGLAASSSVAPAAAATGRLCAPRPREARSPAGG